jgi:hypothetical protein
MAKQRRQHKQREQSVDDAGNGCQELDHKRKRTGSARRRQFGQKDGAAQA